jgi:HK97 family phage prohead protease
MTQRFDRESGFGVASFKARGDQTKGEFEALVSVFGNVDHGGDRVMPGAFSKSLAKWQESGDPIPVIWNHQWDNPLAHIGKADPMAAVETDEGLVVKGELDLDNEFAAQVYRLLAERRVKELSFGYNVVDAEKAKDGALELRELDLIEVGPTLKGMNPATQLLAVKSYGRAELKAGRKLFEPLTGDDATAVKRSAALLAAQLTADEKAGARLSKETRTAISQAIDLLSSLISADSAPAEEPKSVEAEATGKASESDMDLLLRLNLLKET